MDIEYLLREIEDLRHQLYVLSEDKELSDPAVVQLSQELDILLNIYYRNYLRLDYRKVV
ncbi:MAG: Spo0E family sporulation regulatory protein-aspartic acid phosphatase [Desulfitobacterium sp.]